MTYREEFFQLLYTLPAVLIAMVFHEYAHGLVSVWMGDDTPRRQGRLSLNPFKHLDLAGVICLAVFKFGWARPVQVNPGAYRRPKLGMALTALAGPMTNFLLAFLGYVVYAVLWKQGFFFAGRALVRLVYSFLMIFVSVNLGLGVFNLIPIPPLDGSRIIGLVLPEKYYFGYMRYERYGLYLLMAIILIENLTNIDILPLNEFKTMIGTWMLKIAAFLVGVPTQM